MNKLQVIIASVVLLVPMLNQAQTNPTQQNAALVKSIANYFSADRETIHLHLNKSIYLTDEKIWLKGYVTEKKSGVPFGATVNANVRLLDESGKVLRSELLYAENSTFEGHIVLDPAMTTGTYFVHAYTSYMNNFAEDESTIYKITIVNPAENKGLNPKQIHHESAEMELFPESGTFLQGNINTFGVKIADCNDNGIAVSAVAVQDGSGSVITQFNTNESGYGKFDLHAQAGKVYSAVYTIAGKQFTKLLPIAQPTGITFSVNNYALPNKTVIKIKTNSESLKLFTADSLSLVLQRPASSAVIRFKFDGTSTEQTVVIPVAEITEGLLAIFLIDNDKNKLGERVIYTPGPPTNATTVSILQQRGDSIVFTGASPLKFGVVSISVLPVATLSDTGSKSIHGTMLFDSSLTSPVKNASYYASNPDRKKRFELDNILLTKSSKYSWEAISQNRIIEIKYPFEQGLTIKGTVNAATSHKGDLQIKLNSFVGENQYAPLNDKNEFYFHNQIVVDSSRIHFSLLRKKTAAPLKMYPQIVNLNRNFLKSFSPKMKVCTIFSDDNFEFPKIADAVALDNITVKSEVKKDTLANKRHYANSMSRGFKITDDVASRYIDVLSFIQAHGYRVSNTGARVTITNLYERSYSGSNSPDIYMDNAPFDDLNMLRGLSMREIDEIFINKHGYGTGSGGATGSIRIYTKKLGALSSNITINSQSMLVQGGFQKWRTFENLKYDNINSPGFQQFGTVSWVPNINTDAAGNFKFSIPNLNQKSVKLFIEGIASDGTMVSEVIELPLN